MRIDDYDYALPPERIAQRPIEPRDASRLLVLERASGAIAHRHFSDIVELIAPEDVLVLNASRVIAARLHGLRASGAGAEILLVRGEAEGTWLAMGHPGGKLKRGRRVAVGPDSEVEIVAVLGDGLRRDPRLATRILGSLERFPLRMVSQAASRRNVTVVLQDSEAAAAMNHLHERFFAREAAPAEVGHGLAS